MRAYRIHVVVPEDRQVTIEFPEAIPSGPVELIVVVPETEAMERAETPPQNRGCLAALARELAQDPRPFKELLPEERQERLHRLRGAGRGLTSGSEEFAGQKSEEIENEEQKLRR